MNALLIFDKYDYDIECDNGPLRPCYFAKINEYQNVRPRNNGPQANEIDDLEARGRIGMRYDDTVVMASCSCDNVLICCMDGRTIR